MKIKEKKLFRLSNLTERELAILEAADAFGDMELCNPRDDLKDYLEDLLDDPDLIFDAWYHKGEVEEVVPDTECRQFVTKILEDITSLPEGCYVCVDYDVD